MDMKNLYHFRCRHLTGSFQVESIEFGEDDDKLITGKYEQINFPVVYKQLAGKKFTDILATGVPYLFLISEKLRNLLKESHFTGWKTYPIILMDKKENHIEGYHGFSVTGIAGQKSYTNSPIIETRYVSDGPLVKLYKGAEIDLSKWDGCDFFVPEGTTGIVIIKKVADILQKNKISNLSLDNVAELKMDVQIWDKMERRKNEKK